MGVPVDEDQFCRLLGRQLGIKHVRPEHHFRNDLGVESIDMQNILGLIEETYGVGFLDEEAAGLETVKDFFVLLQRHKSGG